MLLDWILIYYFLIQKQQILFVFSEKKLFLLFRLY